MLTHLYIDSASLQRLTLGTFETYVKTNQDAMSLPFDRMPPRAEKEYFDIFSTITVDEFMGCIDPCGSFMTPKCNTPKALIDTTPHIYIVKLRADEHLDMNIIKMVEHSCRCVAEQIYAFMMDNVYTTEAMNIVSLCKNIYIQSKKLDVGTTKMHITNLGSTMNITIGDVAYTVDHWSIVVYFIAMLLPRQFYRQRDTSNLIFHSTDEIYQILDTFKQDKDTIRYFSDNDE